MRHFTLSISIFVLGLFAGNGVFAKETTIKKIIQLVNKTKVDIVSVQISPSGRKQWSNNILVTGVFKKDEHEVLTFTPQSKNVCEYDLKTVKVNGDSIIFNKLNLCHLLNVTLYFEDNTAYLKQNIIIENQTGFTFDEMYVSDTNTDLWSLNILGTVVLSDGDEAYISFTPREDNCIYDLRVRRFSGIDVLFENINMCYTYKVTLYWGEGVAYVSFFDFQ